MNKVIVDSTKKSVYLELKELIKYHDLFLILAYRDFRVRYAQTFLGLFWAVIQPVATLIIFVLVFGKAINIDTKEIPYPLFAISGIALWSYFSFVLNQSGQSIIGAQEMIKKIYFPRLIIPLSKSIVGIIDLIISFVVILILMYFYGFTPSLNSWIAPLFVFLNILAALGIGIWVSALTVRFRDFQHIVPFIVQFGLYATPVAYPADLIPENYQWLYNCNPMVGIIEGFRWSLFGGAPPSATIWISVCLIITLFISSIIYFKKAEEIVADIV